MKPTGKGGGATASASAKRAGGPAGACLGGRPSGESDCEQRRSGVAATGGKRCRAETGNDRAPEGRQGFADAKRCKTSALADRTAECKVKIASVLAEFSALGLEFNPAGALVRAAPQEAQTSRPIPGAAVHAGSKEGFKGHQKRPPQAKKICSRCSAVLAVPADSQAGIDFCCASAVGKHACVIRCMWTGCKKTMCGSIMNSFDRFRCGVAEHAKECSCKQPTLGAVASRLVKLSVCLPYSAVRDANEQMWVQFAEDCLNCRSPEVMGNLIRRLYDQIKPTTLHTAWLASESSQFVRETLRVKTIANAALLVLRLQYGAVHWGRVDRCFGIERAADTLTGLAERIAQRECEEARMAKANVDGGKVADRQVLISGPAAKKDPKSGAPDKGSTVATPLRLDATPTPTNLVPTPAHSKMPPVAAGAMLGFGDARPGFSPTKHKATLIAPAVSHGRSAFGLSDKPSTPPPSAAARAGGHAGEPAKAGGHLDEPVAQNRKKKKPVFQLSVGTRQVVQIHPSLSDAANAASVGKSQMHKTIKGQAGLKGYLWQYLPPDAATRKLPALTSMGGSEDGVGGAFGGSPRPVCAWDTGCRSETCR